MASPNPFRLKYTEQQRDTAAFVRTFGVDMLDILPDDHSIWDRLVVIRSASGAGKTSTLRVLTPDSLRLILQTASHDEGARELKKALERVGVLSESLQRFGVMVSVGSDYRSLIDLGPHGAGQQKVFFKLLDARVLARFVEAVVTMLNLSSGDAGRVTLRPIAGPVGEAAREAIHQLLPEFADRDQPVSVVRLLAEVRAQERGVLRLLDSLVPVNWELESGHARLYALPLLSGVEIFLDEAPARIEPVLLFDDVHDLDRSQRDDLYEQLLDRSAVVGRWIAERKSAAPDEELRGSTPGREFKLIRLEDELMMGARGGASPQRLERILGSIANSRAAVPFSAVAVSESFTQLLAAPAPPSESTQLAALQMTIEQAERIAIEHPRYTAWVESVRANTGEMDPVEAAAVWRERTILMERDLARSQPMLFEMDVPIERVEQLSSAATKAAARLFVAMENKLPYYFGPSMLADLSSRNVEQYLTLAGDLFELMTSAVVLRRGAHLSASEQDERVRRRSRQLWDAIPRRVPNGPEVLALLRMIAELSQQETFRPTAPYAPGVTGTAILLGERESLFNQQDARYDRHERLRRTLATAVAHNLLEMSLDPVQVKGRQWIVLYLNRLLCPAYELPLQRGGFRERAVSTLADQLNSRMTSSAGSRSRSFPNDVDVLSAFEGEPDHG